jgi:hypothetical protein
MDPPRFVSSNALLISVSGIGDGANIYTRFLRVVMSCRARRSAQIGIAVQDMIGHSDRK